MNYFELLERQFIPSLNLHADVYQDAKTGAEHIHLDCPDNSENVFLVAIRTVPEDNSGVAHILEHTSLCGSANYPVRDPFFMMARRSINSFMNAMTSSDWTAYPFASNNRKHFNNLLHVYLDSVFFPNLNELDFIQEGHRLEFSEIDNPNSELQFKGVVFNEMKGAMSSPISVLWHSLCKHLYPTTSYRYNSGGEPEAIPNLTYQQLLEFHRTHYQPSNSIFMTFGDIPAAQHQQLFQSLVFDNYKAAGGNIDIPLEQRLQKQSNVVERYSVSDLKEEAEGSHLVLAWLLGESAKLKDIMEALLLSKVLLEDSASPLYQVLETTDLGKAPSPLCGFSSDQKEICFICGLEGIASTDVDAIETLIYDCLTQVAKEGISQDRLQATLQQLELQQREITGGRYPYGLQLLMSCISSAVHRGNPIDCLNIDALLVQLRASIKDSNYIKELVQRLLLDNNHCIRLCLLPDAELNQEKQEREKQWLASIYNNLSDVEKQKIVRQSQQLVERQQVQEEAGLLPEVSLDDINPDTHWAQGKQYTEHRHKVTQYLKGTNGIVYQQHIMQLPTLSEEQLQLLPLYSYLLTQVGCGDLDYLQMQRKQTQTCGGISARISLESQPETTNRGPGYWVLSSKSLSHQQTQMAELLELTLNQARFDGGERIFSLIEKLCTHKQNLISSSGHSLAMRFSSQWLSNTAWVGEYLFGLTAIKRLRSLSQQLQKKPELIAFCDRLQQLHQHLQQGARQTLFIGEAAELKAFRAHWRLSTTKGLDSQPPPMVPFDLDSLSPLIQQPEQRSTYWLINSQVNFCSRSYSSVPLVHPDSAPLSVLAILLNNNFLHRSIREQGGAYGGGALYNSDLAVFSFYSYRDPRLAASLNDFDNSIDWVLNASLTPSMIEEAVLMLISRIDKPNSPAGDAKQAFHSELFGYTKSLREQLRKAIRAVDENDLKRVAQSYLFEPRSQQLYYSSVLGGKQSKDSLKGYRELSLL